MELLNLRWIISVVLPSAINTPKHIRDFMTMVDGDPQPPENHLYYIILLLIVLFVNVKAIWT